MNAVCRMHIIWMNGACHNFIIKRQNHTNISEQHIKRITYIYLYQKFTNFIKLYFNAGLIDARHLHWKWFSIIQSQPNHLPLFQIGIVFPTRRHYTPIHNSFMLQLPKIYWKETQTFVYTTMYSTDTLTIERRQTEK